MKTPLWLLVCINTVSICLAQSSPDTIRTMLSNALAKHDSTGVATFRALLGNHFYGIKQYDSALKYFYPVVKDRENSTKTLRALALNSIGACYSQMGFTDSAASYYIEAIALYGQLHDQFNVLRTKGNLAIIYKDVGLYEKALENAFDVIAIIENQPPSQDLASCYNTIAVVYEKTNDPQSALEYHFKALRIRQAIGMTRGVASSYNNIGEAYRKTGRYDSALSNLFKAIAIKRQLSDEKSAASTLHNIGCVYMDINDFTLAEKYLNESLNIKRSITDKNGLATTLISLAELRIKQKHLPEAWRMLGEAKKVVEETHSLNHLKQVLELSMTVQQQVGNAKEALAIAKELFIVKDSLLNTEVASNLKALELKFETEKKEQQIEILQQKDLASQAELETRQTQLLALAGLVILLILLALLIWKYARTVKKNKSRVEMLLKELHHRVKNNLQILSSILSLQSQQLTDEHAIQAVRNNEGRINAMALIHKKLYNDDQERSINIKEYITELIQYLVYTYGYHEKELKLNVLIEEIQVDVDKAIPLGLVLNELISNAFKHAYGDQSHPELLVSLKQKHKDGLEIQISDNGKGMIKEKSVAEETAFGVKMVNTLIRELKGNYEVSNDLGTKYTLNIPLT